MDTNPHYDIDSLASIRNLAGGLPFVKGHWYYVDATNGGTATDGLTPTTALTTIQAAIDKCDIGDGVAILPKEMAVTDTDPGSYAENIILATPLVTLFGIGNRTQGGLPQIKKGSGTSAQLTVRAPGCIIKNLGVNGGSATGGGGILLDDDGGSTKSAFGTIIEGCHFKNCRGSSATDSRTGGAIQWAAAGNSWQILIRKNLFFKNVGDIILLGTGGSIPQDVVIEKNTFQGLAASVDCHIYLAAGSGMSPVTIDRNIFADVLPALGSGSVTRYVDLTGCTGIFSNNYFSGSYTTTGFGAAKAAAKIPTTVGIVNNYSDAGLIVREA